MNSTPAATTPDALVRQCNDLWGRQPSSWPMMADGARALRQAHLAEFDLDGSPVLVQCNPARTVSASARIDAASLARRRCFLCLNHLPAEQERIVYRDRWLILCNPAPLFEPHFTVAAVDHVPQRIASAIETILDLARDFDGQYTVFYNGPASGASAPDHLHLQAGPTNLMPFEKTVRALARKQLDFTSGPIPFLTAPPLRSAIVTGGDDRDALIASLRKVIDAIGQVRPAEPEPMLNLFTLYVENRWLVWLFPRAAHRPHFYGHDDEDFLISPGAVDVNGIIICPRPNDYERLTPEILRSIYDEVVMSHEELAQVGSRLQLAK